MLYIWNIDGNNYKEILPQDADVETWEHPAILGSRQKIKSKRNFSRKLSLQNVDLQDFERPSFLKRTYFSLIPETILWNGL